MALFWDPGEANTNPTFWLRSLNRCRVWTYHRLLAHNLCPRCRSGLISDSTLCVSCLASKHFPHSMGHLCSPIPSRADLECASTVDTPLQTPQVATYGISSLTHCVGIHHYTHCVGIHHYTHCVGIHHYSLLQLCAETPTMASPRSHLQITPSSPSAIRGPPSSPTKS